MNIRKIQVLGLLALCIWNASALTGCSGPVAASRAWTVTWPVHYFVPYSYDAFNQTDLVTLARASGTRFFTLAFVTTGKDRPCQPAWNGRQPVGAWMQASINALRAAGGDVRVAFGGSSGTELANSCVTFRDLQSRYQSVIDTYRLTHLDFDVEGKTLMNARANDLRNKAIAALQVHAADLGRPLDISYTLPVNVNGLNWKGLNLLHDAIRNGVRINTVNIMTMDYYSKKAPGDQMGQNALRAANNVFRQLRSLYPSKSPSRVWAMLGITPMIGVNDDHREVFTLRDAQTVLDFATRQHITLLSFWSLQHDHSCTKGELAPHHCTGVAQTEYQYARTFTDFAGVFDPEPNGE